MGGHLALGARQRQRAGACRVGEAALALAHGVAGYGLGRRPPNASCRLGRVSGSSPEGPRELGPRSWSVPANAAAMQAAGQGPLPRA
jgi:hypothetical protein